MDISSSPDYNRSPRFVQRVKKDGAREPFRAEKIRLGLERACWKRPIPTDRVEAVFSEIVQEILLLSDSEITSEAIGEMVMEKLIDLDDVAYIRFASVYRQFKDARDFVQGVQPILDRQDRVGDKPNFGPES